MLMSAGASMQVLGSLLRVRTLVHQHTAKHDEDRLTHFLYGATRGDTELVQQVTILFCIRACSLRCAWFAGLRLFLLRQGGPPLALVQPIAQQSPPS